MMLTMELLDSRYHINTDFAWSLAIPLAFNAAQPNHFGAEIASANPMQAGGFVGDTEQGGSCNVNELRLNPHCNGTHTESIRHICDASGELSLSIADLQLPPLMPCVLISLTPELALTSADSYTPAFAGDDKIISRAMLEQALAGYDNEQLQALVLRTLPNNSDKCRQSYGPQHQPAFFSHEAMLYLNERGVEHLLCDLPSLDRLHDDGLLSCHHLFWQVPQGAHQATPNSLLHKTVTEMAFIGNELDDGFYALSLQSPAFVNDAAPSRPVLYGAERC